MLGEVMDGTADFAIGDISITSVRASNFAFSMPWMNLGISILYVKPRAAPPSLLAFLDPFTTDVSRVPSELSKYFKYSKHIIQINNFTKSLRRFCILATTRKK